MRSFPKPLPRVTERLAAKRLRDRRAAEFRLAVWVRDLGRCQHCQKRVSRYAVDMTQRGEVHHRLTRGAHPDLKFDVDNGVLLCVGCHVAAQRGEIRV